MTDLAISQEAFEQLRRMFHEVSGIELAEDRQHLVQLRLSERINALGHASFDDYCRFLRVEDHGQERQVAIDLLTTHETYFFREPSHFKWLADEAATRFKGRSLRIWSAACSSGEEPYSIAMTLLDRHPERVWELRASDLSARVLDRARLGVFPLQHLEHMPPQYLQRFCQRGSDAYEGTLRVNDEVRNCVQFFQHNLLHDMHSLGLFDVIFLRNALIYFDIPRRQDILLRLLERLQPNGLLFLGHAEPTQGLTLPVRLMGHAVFEKVA